MMLYSRLVKRAGFTLIEIMIVIAIIAILAGIVVPNFVQARQESQLVACGENCKNIGLALAAYLVRHSDYELFKIIDTRVGDWGRDDVVAVERLSRIKERGENAGLDCNFDLVCPATCRSYYVAKDYFLYPDMNPMNGSNVYYGWMVLCSHESSGNKSVCHRLDQTYVRPVYLVGVGRLECYKDRV